MRSILALILCLILAPTVRGTTVSEICRISGQGTFTIKGLGLVIGLNGTGDSGKELAMARPLAQVLENSGNPIGSLEDLAKNKSVALVWVDCTIPEQGGRSDRFDVHVSTIHSASSLAGGRLLLTPLTGPRVNPSTVYAMAWGAVELEGDTPTVGRVREGAQLVRDIKRGNVGPSFEILLNPYFGGWSSSVHVSTAINDNYFARPDVDVDPIATAVDDRTIRIVVPPAERADPAAFVADVMSTPINQALMQMPAQVIVNRRTGVIVITGNVVIPLTALTHKNLTITRTIPQPQPTPEDPIIERSRWAALGEAERERDEIRLQDLINAFKQLDIPTPDQIDILQMLKKTGQLQAKLIID